MKRLILLTLILCPVLAQAGFMDKVRKVNQYRATSAVKAAAQAYLAYMAFNSNLGISSNGSVFKNTAKATYYRLLSWNFGANGASLESAIVAGALGYAGFKLGSNAVENAKHALGIK